MPTKTKFANPQKDSNVKDISILIRKRSQYKSFIKMQEKSSNQKNDSMKLTRKNKFY